MPFDPSRLHSALLNTGLQSKDNPLYQVIHQLIGVTDESSKSISSINNAVITNTTNINNIIDSNSLIRPTNMMFPEDGLDGESSFISGPTGPIGLQGLQGPPGEDGDDGGNNPFVFPDLSNVAYINKPNSFSANIQTITADNSAIALVLRGRASDDIAILNMSTNAGSVQGRWQMGPSQMQFGTFINVPIALYVNSTESVRFHQSGGVSIGDTTDPGATNLRVAGSANILSGLTVASTQVLNTTTALGVVSWAVNSTASSLIQLNKHAATDAATIDFALNGTMKWSTGYLTTAASGADVYSIYSATLGAIVLKLFNTGGISNDPSSPDPGANNLRISGTANIIGGLTSSTQDLITRTGTLVSGVTGAGFTIALTTSTVTGTLADAQLSTNVPLINAANAFTNTMSIAGLITATSGILCGTSGDILLSTNRAMSFRTAGRNYEYSPAVDEMSFVVAAGEYLHATATLVTLQYATKFGATLNLKNYTVATLPAGTRGDIAYVTDALTPKFLEILVGGGAIVTPAFYNGTDWVGF